MVGPVAQRKFDKNPQLRQRMPNIQMNRVSVCAYVCVFNLAQESQEFLSDNRLDSDLDVARLVR